MEEKQKILIEVKRLCAAYDGHPVLRDVNLTVRERDFLGVVGPNGGGKTTLVKCILGLLEPVEGEITCHPGPSSGAKLRMGYLPQYARIDRKFPITVAEVVLSGLAGSKSLVSPFTSAQRQKAREVIRRMGLDGLERRPIGALSGGQLQRTLLGRAVIADPEVLILDEPDAYLDRSSETRLYALLEELRRTCAVILVSHDAEAVRRLATTLVRVDGTASVMPARSPVASSPD